MKNKFPVAILIVALLIGILWGAHHFNFIAFVKHLHGG